MFQIFKKENGYKVGRSNGKKLLNGRYYTTNKCLTKPQALRHLEKLYLDNLVKKNALKYNKYLNA
tara:strand:- start:221 stop:415 length:195 start_codon:yes stop_codon:yes gene_type:complete